MWKSDVVIKSLVKSAFQSIGLQVERIQHPGRPNANALPDQPAWINDIIRQVRPYTMTGSERIAALCQSVAHIERWNIPGDIVECGVWRGGSMMAAALCLLHLDRSRTLYLFDTFAGMGEPTSADVEALSGRPAEEMLRRSRAESLVWAISQLHEVKENIASTGYPAERVHYIKGKVEDTIPATLPEKIAILRLDTDWYESTRHELTHLWSQVVSGGILIIDDYGHWAGSRKAVDEFCDTIEVPLFLNRIDYSGRLIVKP